MKPPNLSIVTLAGGHNTDSQVVGLDQQVGVVEQDDLGPLHQQEEGELDEQHQGQLPDAADVQEDRAGQQGQQHAVAEILRQRGGGVGGGEEEKGYTIGFHANRKKQQKKTTEWVHERVHARARMQAQTHSTLRADLWEMAGHGLAGTQSQAVLCCPGQVAQQAESHVGVLLAGHALLHVLPAAGELAGNDRRPTIKPHEKTAA